MIHEQIWDTNHAWFWCYAQKCPKHVWLLSINSFDLFILCHLKPQTDFSVFSMEESFQHLTHNNNWKFQCIIIQSKSFAFRGKFRKIISHHCYEMVLIRTHLFISNWILDFCIQQQKNIEYRISMCDANSWHWYYHFRLWHSLKAYTKIIHFKINNRI